MDMQQPLNRVRIERTIDALVFVLDAMDGDADAEPSLGSQSHLIDQVMWAVGLEEDPDLEADDSDLEATGDDELMLGSPGCASLDRQSQEDWAQGSARADLDECEAVDEDGGNIVDEPHDDDDPREPSLGSPEGQGDQTRWGRSATSDLEEQCEDEGGQCEDEGAWDDREPEDDERSQCYGAFVADQSAIGVAHDLYIESRRKAVTGQVVGPDGRDYRFTTVA